MQEGSSEFTYGVGVLTGPKLQAHYEGPLKKTGAASANAEHAREKGNAKHREELNKIINITKGLEEEGGRENVEDGGKAIVVYRQEKSRRRGD